MRTCIVCGCTDNRACTRTSSTEDEYVTTTCSWVHIEGESGICSFCAEDADLVEEQLVDVPPEPRLILPGDPEFHL
jgi:hypothetical protein